MTSNITWAYGPKWSQIKKRLMQEYPERVFQMPAELRQPLPLRADIIFIEHNTQLNLVRLTDWSKRLPEVHFIVESSEEAPSNLNCRIRHYL